MMFDWYEFFADFLPWKVQLGCTVGLVALAGLVALLYVLFS